MQPVLVAKGKEARALDVNVRMPTERLAVDTREAARLTGLSPRTIQNYIAAKLLPARKIGRRTVLHVKDLETFLKRDQPSVSKPRTDADGR